MACSLMELNIHSVFVDFDIANILLLIHIDQDEGKHVSVGQRVLWLDFFYFSTIAQNCTTLCRFICPLLRVNYHSVHLKFEPKSNINIFFGTCYQAFIPGYPVIRMFGKLIANYSAKRQQAMRKQTPLWRQNNCICLLWLCSELWCLQSNVSIEWVEPDHNCPGPCSK